MKDIKEYFNSNIIFKSIITEAKESLPIVNTSFEEWLKELPNDKGGADVISISGLPTEDRFKNKVISLASTSFISAFKELNNRLENPKNNCGIIVIPFNNFYIAIKCDYYSNKLDCMSIFGIQPKLVSIKSVINISRSIYKVQCTVYLNGNENEKEVIDHILKYVNRQEIIDRNDNKANFIDKLNQEFGAEAQEANAKAKEVTPDNSPFTLTKKKKFPDYIKHCLIKEKDNAIVRKYADWGEAEIFVETVKKDNKKYYKVYMGDVMACFNNGTDSYMYTFYLLTLGSLDKFLEYALKPNRQKMHSELGADGEIHVWYSSMQKHLPPVLKKDCIKDENLIKELKFHDFYLDDLYK